MVIVSDPFWAEDVSILYRQDRLIEFFITKDQTLKERLNSIARFFVYVAILLGLYYQSWKYLLVSLIGFIITYFVFVNSKDEMKKEITATSEEEVDNFITMETKTTPTLTNPLMNANIFDLAENPDKPPAAFYSSNDEQSLKIKQQIEKDLSYGLYKDLDDVYDRDSSQRQFFTMPYGLFPSPNGEVQKALYGNMKSCKSDRYACFNYQDLRGQSFINTKK